MILFSVVLLSLILLFSDGDGDGDVRKAFGGGGEGGSGGCGDFCSTFSPALVVFATLFFGVGIFFKPDVVATASFPFDNLSLDPFLLFFLLCLPNHIQSVRPCDFVYAMSGL